MKPKYAVIVCPTCHKAKIIEQDKKTTTCPFCNTRHYIKKIMIQYQTNNQEKARKIIGLIHAKQDGRQEEAAQYL
jgi:endogenous inhibitor of DNA gyrase (YacG/DUF329 family)